MKKTSIILVSCNTLEFTQIALLSMRKFKPSIPYEIIVIDNGSIDGSAEWLRTIKWDNFKFVPLAYNLMFSRAVNVGRYFADRKSEYLFLTHSDIQVCKEGWLEDRIAPMEKDSNIGICGSPYFIHNWKTGGKFLFEGSGDKENIEYIRDFHKKCLYQEDIIKTVSSSDIATRVRVWDKLGGCKHEGDYKQNFFIEDYCIRAQLEGYTIKTDLPLNKVYHYEGISNAYFENMPNYEARKSSVIGKAIQYLEEIPLVE